MLAPFFASVTRLYEASLRTSVRIVLGVHGLPSAVVQSPAMRTIHTARSLLFHARHRRCAGTCPGTLPSRSLGALAAASGGSGRRSQPRGSNVVRVQPWPLSVAKKSVVPIAQRGVPRADASGSSAAWSARATAQRPPSCFSV